MHCKDAMQIGGGRREEGKSKEESWKKYAGRRWAVVGGGAELRDLETSGDLTLTHHPLPFHSHREFTHRAITSTVSQSNLDPPTQSSISRFTPSTMSFLFGGQPKMSSEQKLAAAETEVEMISDMFTRCVSLPSTRQILL